METPYITKTRIVVDRFYNPNYGDWAVVVLDAVRKTLKDNGLYDENGDADKIVLWFSW